MKHWPASPAVLAHQCLQRALLARIGSAQVVREACTPWASATFTGSRHVWQMRIEGASVSDATRHGAATLQDAEFDLPGSILADISATWADEGGLTIEALTVEAG